jgi:D-glycero-beta-D-manno-heptose 1-phosphate adenylyltransferase
MSTALPQHATAAPAIATKIVANYLDLFPGTGHFSLKKPWVLTNGVFDLLHRGHVSYLQAARALGAQLVVALNSDASAKRLGKGADRPINRQADRAFVIAALACVDAVTFFDEDSPCTMIEALRPDIIVKGGDYDMSRLPETKLVQSWGGRAVALPFEAGYSTSDLLRRIRAA